jgi:uncharacterized protein (DUF1499 family)
MEENNKSNFLWFCVIFSFFSLNALANSGAEMNTKCGDKPNCISSYETRSSFSIQPINNAEGTWTEVKEKIKKTLSQVSNVKVIAESDRFIHFVATTRVLRFKDDVYFWWDESSKTLNMKSESRVGYSDLGANSKRLKKFIKLWEAK